MASGSEILSHSTKVIHPLTASVVQEMIPVYKRMSDTKLLKRMEKGKTQNTNECLHSVIWSRCPKTVFIGKHKLHGVLVEAYKGTRRKHNMKYRKIGLTTSQYGQSFFPKTISSWNGLAFAEAPSLAVFRSNFI